MTPFTPLSLNEFKKHLAITTTLLLDLRHQDDFIKEHIPNSIFIGIDGPFDKWIQLIAPDKNTNLLLILPEEKRTKCIENLSILGYVNVIGFLNGGISTWKAKHKTNSLHSISPKQFLEKRKLTSIDSIDIRKKSEYETSHIKNTTLFPLTLGTSFVNQFNSDNNYYIFCGGGYRSVIAISYLHKHKITQLTNIEKGFRGITEAQTLM